jgi:hypothetical protein
MTAVQKHRAIRSGAIKKNPFNLAQKCLKDNNLDV